VKVALELASVPEGPEVISSPDAACALPPRTACEPRTPAATAISVAAKMSLRPVARRHLASCSARRALSRGNEYSPRFHTLPSTDLVATFRQTCCIGAFGHEL
jgi:hypothetical protein